GWAAQDLQGLSGGCRLLKGHKGKPLAGVSSLVHRHVDLLDVPESGQEVRELVVCCGIGEIADPQAFCGCVIKAADANELDDWGELASIRCGRDRSGTTHGRRWEATAPQLPAAPAPWRNWRP